MIPGNGVGGTVGGRRVIASLGGSGGYAERVAVPAAALIDVPDAMALDDAVALLADGRTATMLAEAAAIAAGERVLILAAAGDASATPPLRPVPHADRARRVPSGPVRADLEHAVAIATSTPTAPATAGRCTRRTSARSRRSPRARCSRASTAVALTEAMDELQRALIWRPTTPSSSTRTSTARSTACRRAPGPRGRGARVTPTRQCA